MLLILILLSVLSLDLINGQGRPNCSVPGRIIRRYSGLGQNRLIHWNHHYQFRPKSGSGDQNKQTVPSVETVGWTATRFYSWTLCFFLWDPTPYSSGRDDVNIRVHSVLAKPVISSTNPAESHVVLTGAYCAPCNKSMESFMCSHILRISICRAL